MAFTLYCIRNLLDGKQYIGQTTMLPRRRWYLHKSNAKCGCPWVLSRAIRAHGVENFVFEPMMEFASQNELNAAEVHLIQTCGSRAPAGYNIALGGASGASTSPETKAKISAARMGMQFSASHRAALSAARKLVVDSPETIEKRAAAIRGIKRTPEQCARQGAAIRHAWAQQPAELRAARVEANRAAQCRPEVRALKSTQQRGRTLTPEHRAKLSAAKLGKRVKPETLARRVATIRYRKSLRDRRSNPRFALAGLSPWA
jgi:group I intron endonuclease